MSVVQLLEKENKNLKEKKKKKGGFTGLLLSLTDPEVIGGGVCHLLISFPYLYVHELLTKYPQGKFLDP